MTKTISLGVLIFLALPAFAQEVRVTDGDTLKLGSTTWRLWGIDAPEGGQRCRRNDAAYDCGDEATAALRRIIGESVPVCRRKDTDRYGRAVGRCAVNGQDIGALLVQEGWALDYRRYSGGRYRPQEALARKHARGIWAGTFEKPWEWRKHNR